MNVKPSRAYWLAATLTVLLAIAYFGSTYDRTLNPSDEGYLLYNFQKTAAGQLPHRDFYDDYGPAGYWLGGALFKAFGTSIIVVRVFMVALKTAMALLIFLIAKRLLPPLAALVAAMLFMVNWGDPLFPAINILYAGHLTHFLTLLGMVLMLRYLTTGRMRWLLGTSICAGLGIIIKFQPAVIDLLGFALFLCLKEQITVKQDAAAEPSTAHPRIPALQFLRALKLLSIVGVGFFYLVYIAGAHLDLAGFFLFLLPLFLFFGHLFAYEFGAFANINTETAVHHWAGLKRIYTELAMLLSVPVVLVVLITIFYAAMGGLPELVYDTFILPTHMKFHAPMLDRTALAALTAAAAFLLFLLILIGEMLKTGAQIPRTLFLIAVIALPLLASVVGPANLLSYRLCHRLTTNSLFPAILLISVSLFCGEWRKGREHDEDAGSFLPLGLVIIFASQSALMMFVRPDETHIVVNSTVLFILSTLVVWKIYHALNRFLPERKPLPGLLGGLALLAMFSFVFLWSMKLLYIPPRVPEEESPSSYPLLNPDAPRARGLELPVWHRFTPPLNHPMSVDLNRTINFIRDTTRPNERIFLLCGDQMIYFLAERESVLQKENYFVYLSNVELIDRTYTGAITDEEMKAKISSAMPRIIVRTPNYVDTVSFGLTWPRTTAFIEIAYQTRRVFGEYEILTPRALPSTTDSTD